MGFDDSTRRKITKYKREFLNREDIRKRINDTVELFNEDDIFKLYSFYGIGGIGKTELLKKIRNKHLENNNVVFIEFNESKDILKKLIDIRNHFIFAPKFDYLFLKYWELTKIEKLNENYIKSLTIQFNKILEKGDKISNTISAINPIICYATDALKIGKSLWEYYQNKKWGNEFAEIIEESSIHPERILRQLHLYLAEDIQSKDNSYNKKPIFIFDNYKKELLDSDIEWLKEFINAFDSGIFIVTSREQLDWRQNPSNKIETNELKNIPKKYVEEYLKRLGIESKYIDLIIRKTQCIPIYLDMGIGAYFSLDEKENLKIIMESKDSLIKAFLNHMSEEEQKIVNILSIIKVFNKEIYNEMLRLNNLDPIDFSFEEFTKRSLTVDAWDGQMYKINEVIANNIEDITHINKKQEYIKQYAKVLTTRCMYKILPHELLTYAINAFRLCDKYIKDLELENINYLFDLIIFILDTCWITEFYGQLKDIKNNNTIKAILSFAESCVERQIDIKTGLKIIEGISLKELSGSKHINTIQCEKNYLFSIEGNYTEAEKNFEIFYNNLKSYEKAERFYVKGAIYYSDMLMLRGKFKDSLRILKDLEDSPYFQLDISQAICYDVKKQVGHCYRFNMLLDKAIFNYDSGRQNKHIRVQAYRLTTLCESLCFFEPEKVKEIEIEALEINNRVRNNNSLAKIYNSLAIVSIHDKNYTKANEYVNKAMELNNKTHYVAGNLFTLVAKSYLEYAKDKRMTKETEKSIFKLFKNVDKIYEYLLLPMYIINDDEENILNIKEQVQWVDFNYTVNKYRKFLNIISS